MTRRRNSVASEAGAFFAGRPGFISRVGVVLPVAPECVLSFLLSMNPASESETQMPSTTDTQREWDADHSAVTDMARGQMSRLHALQARIDEAGGTITVARYVLTDLDGTPVDAKLTETKFGEAWKVAGGGFVGHAPKRESTLTRKGYRETEVREVVKGKAAHVGGGSGFSGLANVMTCARPADESVVWNRIVGLGDLTDREPTDAERDAVWG